MNVLSPSDIVGPSPVTSNGTETTEIEDDIADDVELDYVAKENHYRQHSDVSNLDTALDVKYACASAELSIGVHAYNQSTGYCSSRQPRRSGLSYPCSGKFC